MEYLLCIDISDKRWWNVIDSSFNAILVKDNVKCSMYDESLNYSKEIIDSISGMCSSVAITIEEYTITINAKVNGHTFVPSLINWVDSYIVSEYKISGNDIFVRIDTHRERLRKMNDLLLLYKSDCESTYLISSAEYKQMRRFWTIMNSFPLNGINPIYLTNSSYKNADNFILYSLDYVFIAHPQCHEISINGVKHIFLTKKQSASVADDNSYMTLLQYLFKKDIFDSLVF